MIESIAFSGLFTTLRKVKENPEQARRVLRASLKGLRYVWENKTGTVDVIESWFKLDKRIASIGGHRVGGAVPGLPGGDRGRHGGGLLVAQWVSLHGHRIH